MATEDDGTECYEWDGEQWSSFWEKDANVITQPQECLLRYQDKLLTDGKHRKVFVPMCGRAVEMKYLEEAGHEVVGLEFAEKAIQQFFHTFNIGFETEPLTEPFGTLYKSTDDKLKIRIYCCDFFKFGPHLEKDFSGVYDAGSMYATEKPRIDDYMTVVKSVLGPDCRYLLVFDSPSCGSDYSIGELKTMFGDQYTVEFLGFTKTEIKAYTDCGLNGFDLYLISSK